LKYCRGKDSAGRIVNYRCGIKTCSRCRRFEFRVGAKSLCVWDEPDFQPVYPTDSAYHNIDELAAPLFLNDSLSRRGGDMRRAVADVGGSDGVFRMKQRPAAAAAAGGSAGSRRRGSAAASDMKTNTALDDDDEDVK